MELLDAPENKGGITSGDAVAHEKLEAHAHATKYFGEFQFAGSSVNKRSLVLGAGYNAPHISCRNTTGVRAGVSGRASTAEPAVMGEDHGLGARPHSELVEEVGDVVAYGLFANPEARGHLRVAETFNYQ